MKVKSTKNKSRIKFCHLVKGDVFLTKIDDDCDGDDDILMKIEFLNISGKSQVNAVFIETGNTTKIDDDETVKHLSNAELITNE